MLFNELETLADEIPSSFGTPGCAVMAMREHETVFFRAAGFSDRERTRPVSRGDLYWIYSVTKVFTSVAALRLIEDGVLRFEDPVSRFLPEWENVSVKGRSTHESGVRPPNVLELLTMAGGLNYDLDAPALLRLRAAGRKATLRAFAKALSEEPLDFIPGERYQYSLCFDLLGAVLEVASGMPVEALFRVLLKEPLGAKDLTFFPAEEQKERFACEYRFDEKTGYYSDIGYENPYVISDGFASTGAGLCAGIEDVALLADALANGGVARTGRRILSPESIEAIAADRLGAAQKMDFEQMKPPQFSYGLGVGIIKSPIGDVPAGGFGWDGAAGALVHIDTERRASLVYMQHVLDHADIPYQIHDALRSAYYRDMKRN
jgi:CubicO group peptidase (beta-lactamase class C family)